MTKAATTAAVTLRMAMRRTHMVGEEVGEMAGAIVLTSTSTIPGRDITVRAIIRSSITVAVRLVMWAAASTAAEAFMVVAEAFTVAAEEDTAAVAAIVE